MQCSDSQTPEYEFSEMLLSDYERCRGEKVVVVVLFSDAEGAPGSRSCSAGMD